MEAYSIEVYLHKQKNRQMLYAAILIIKIGFLKARRWRTFKKPILVFPAPSALETPKLVS